MSIMSIPTGELHALVTRALTRYLPAEPLTDEDARRAAWWLLEAELLGLPQFGIAMLLRELERLGPPGGAGPADPASRLRIDARAVPGHLAMAGAVRLATAGAAAAGVAVVSLTGVGALGILGSPARALAHTGLVGVALANSGPLVAPWGGSAPALGTNPIAVAAPRADQPPLVVDYATSPTTVAALRDARERDADLPEPGGFDHAGNPVRAARDVHALAPDGRLGSLTGLTVEILAGIAAGGRRPGPGRSALVLALDPAAFGGDEAAAVCAQLGADWRSAGGHVPARFDALPAGPADAPPTLAAPRAGVAALEAATEGNQS